MPNLLQLSGSCVIITTAKQRGDMRCYVSQGYGAELLLLYQRNRADRRQRDLPSLRRHFPCRRLPKIQIRTP